MMTRKINHYCYKIILEGSDLYYTGRRSTSKDIDKDTYKGSGKWVKSIKDQSRLTKIILGEYDNIHDLKAAEQAFIEQWFDDPNCMNYARSSLGTAPGHKFSEETRRRVSVATSGENNPNYGKKHSEETLKKMSDKKKGKKSSEETKQKLSDAHKGEKCFWYGKTLSEEHRQKLSDAKRGKKISEEIRKKMSAAHKNTLLGENNPMVKLKEPQVREIREKYSTYSMSYTKLSEEYSVSKTTISKIVTRKTWKQL
jgi:hypothetical protein